jgi:hypothetical protein
LCLAGQTTLLAQGSPASADPQSRIAQIIRAYEEQGIHRTGTKVDQVSGDWLATEIRKSGLTPAREVFKVSRIDPVTASLSIDGHRIEGVPLFDGGFTDSAGIAWSRRLGWAT